MTVDQLAAQAGMSVRNFLARVQERYWRNAADFVEAARLDAARRMLEESRFHPQEA